MMNLRAFGKSVRNAVRGIYAVAHAEQSFRLQMVAAALVYAVLLTFPLDAWERILMILLVSMVLVLEIVNSILERIVDAVEPRVSPMVRDVKDMMAGAVLITALTAAVVGAMILAPHFLTMLY